MLEVVDQDVIVHPQKEVEFYLINGKRSTTPRKLRAGEIVTIGSTKVKLISFEETPAFSKKNILNQKLNELIENGSQKLPVIEALSKLSK